MALATLIAARDAPTATALGSFNPTLDFSLSSTATGASADATIVLTIPTGDYLGAGATSGPQGSLTTGPTNCNVAPASQDIQCGEVAAEINSGATLGFANGACNNLVAVPFVMLNASVDITDTIDPVSQTDAGSQGVLENLWTDTGDAPGADTPPPSPGPAEEDGLPAHINMYPSYLNTIFTPEGELNALTPVARYAGATLVAGSIVTLDLVIFSPGQLAAAFAPPNPLAALDASLGYSSIVILGDPTQPSSPSAITSFCTSLTSTTILYGEYHDNPCRHNSGSSCDAPGEINSPCGQPFDCTTALGVSYTRATTPTVAGTYLYTSVQGSARDLDADGIEQGLDTCPFTTNIDGDPRTTSGPDGDMLDSACDPTPATNTGGGNHDGDGIGSPQRPWVNAADNCPTIANDDQANTEGLGTTSYRDSAPRGGPKGDSIGDACDPDDTLANGRFISSMIVDPICIGGTDADDDGFCSTDDPDDGNASKTPESIAFTFQFPVVASGSGVNSSVGGTVSTGLGLEKNPASIANDGSSVSNNADDGTSAVALAGAGQPYQFCNDGIDNDGDTLIDLLDPGCEITGGDIGGTDTDRDGYTDNAEYFLGTDALGRCEVDPTPSTPAGPKHSTDWPSDLDSTTKIPSSIDKISITDLTNFLAPTPRLGTSPGDAGYSPRFDLVPGKTFPFPTWIALNDLTALIAGPTGSPPMFGGSKAFGGPACTADPTLGD